MNLSGIWRLASVYAGGMLGSQLITIASLPLVARLYAPEVFGQYAAVLSVVGIISIGATLRLEQALHLPRSEHVASDVRRVALLVAMVVAIATGLLATAALFTFKSAVSATDLLNWCLLLPALCAASGSFNVLTAWAGRQGCAARAARAQIVRAALTATVQLSIATVLTTHRNATSLLVAGLLGLLAGIAATSVRADAGRAPRSLRRYSRLRLLAVLRRFRDFPRFSAPQGLLAALTNYSPTLILMMLTNAQLAGQFAMAERIVKAPILLISGSLRQGFTQGLAKVQRGRSPITGYSSTLTRQIALVLLLPVVVAFFMAPPAVKLLMGRQWVEAGLIAQVMMPWVYLNAVAVPMGAMLQVTRQLESVLKKDVVLLILKVIALVGTALLAGPWAAVLVAALAPAVSSAVMILVGMRVKLGSVQPGLR
jgi:O-antigen/teichoic acid export membrane protein